MSSGWLAETGNNLYNQNMFSLTHTGVKLAKHRRGISMKVNKEFNKKRSLNDPWVFPSSIYEGEKVFNNKYGNKFSAFDPNEIYGLKKNNQKARQTRDVVNSNYKAKKSKSKTGYLGNVMNADYINNENTNDLAGCKYPVKTNVHSLGNANVFLNDGPTGKVHLEDINESFKYLSSGEKTDKNKDDNLPKDSMPDANQLKK